MTQAEKSVSPEKFFCLRKLLLLNRNKKLLVKLLPKQMMLRKKRHHCQAAEFLPQIWAEMTTMSKTNLADKETWIN